MKQLIVCAVLIALENVKEAGSLAEPRENVVCVYEVGPSNEFVVLVEKVITVETSPPLWSVDVLLPTTDNVSVCQIDLDMGLSRSEVITCAEDVLSFPTASLVSDRVLMPAAKGFSEPANRTVTVLAFDCVRLNIVALPRELVDCADEVLWLLAALLVTGLSMPIEESAKLAGRCNLSEATNAKSLQTSRPKLGTKRTGRIV